MDTTRIRDGTIVVFKRVDARSDEVAINLMLNAPEQRSDPHNPAVPILDCFTIQTKASSECPYSAGSMTLHSTLWKKLYVSFVKPLRHVCFNPSDLRSSPNPDDIGNYLPARFECRA